jgi:isoaspartyl peptidase/L-asparaginase-like protein (Ntn-hydrolase superfamily)
VQLKGVMMKYAVISTWKMSLDGTGLACGILKEGGGLAASIKAAINDVENNPDYRSVGYGGLPNREGEVELDAAYMDGSTGLYGGVMGVKDIANPIDLAIELSKRQLNCLLSGAGAEKYARARGFAFKNMLTEESKKRWDAQAIKSNDSGNITAYNGHDTVCVIGRREADFAVGVSTSGLFLKAPGRIGDSPLIGAGLYSDSRIGAAAATGVGEDIIRGCLSYETVKQMEGGKPAQRACEDVLSAYTERMNKIGLKIGAVSLIALGADGSFGGTTNLPEFAFIYADQDNPPAVWLAYPYSQKAAVEKADAARLKKYAND